MSPAELTAAMRHGSRNPVLPREATDLGRFGLGLKTASLSQCRTLTVVSWREVILSARRWDLDYVARRDNWMLLDVHDAADLQHVSELLQQAHGTMVLWQNFDKLSAGETSTQDALGNRIDLARDHLALVFHRFLGSSQHAFSIALNLNPLRALDPFLTSHKATMPLSEEDFIVEGERVHVTPYILPHLSKLSASDLQVAGGEEGLRRNQGFYVYRNERLISWGSWFRLVRQEELTKLARVQVDTTNKLDHLWCLDVKKSTAHPPEVLRTGSARSSIGLPKAAGACIRSAAGRTGSDKIIRTWDRHEVRGGFCMRCRIFCRISAVSRASACLSSSVLR